jgi:hypothetical protein
MPAGENPSCKAEPIVIVDGFGYTPPTNSPDLQD